MKKLIVTALALLFLSVFVGATLLRQYYTRRMPETPQVQDGRTIAIEANYGKTVYVTLREKRQLDAAYISVGLAGLTLMLVAFKPAKNQKGFEASL